jgi:hypothetical protein
MKRIMEETKSPLLQSSRRLAQASSNNLAQFQNLGSTLGANSERPSETIPSNNVVLPMPMKNLMVPIEQFGKTPSANWGANMSGSKHGGSGNATELDLLVRFGV